MLYKRLRRDMLLARISTPLSCHRVLMTELHVDIGVRARTMPTAWPWPVRVPKIYFAAPSIDQMIRECGQEDVKTFRYTACPLSSKTPNILFMLCVEAMAYEADLTGDREHLRILRKGFQAAIPKADGNWFGKVLGQLTFFAPYVLEALEREGP